MNTMTRQLVVALALAVLAAPAFADSEEVDCSLPQNARFKQAAQKRYQDMLAHDKAGRAQQAYDSAINFDARCIAKGEREIDRMENERAAVIKRSSLRLGEEAEKKGRLAEAYKYYEYFHGLAADRVQMKLATAKPGDFKSVQAGIGYMRSVQGPLREGEQQKIGTADADRTRLAAMGHYSSQSEANKRDPDRAARLKAIEGYLGKLTAIAKRQGEKFLADEDKVFRARKASLVSKHDTFGELNKARDWLGLAGQERRVNERAIKRGDTLLADDSRKSLELAISYYQFPHDDLGDKRTQKVQDKARRLGDAHLKKGEKKIAADYYGIAGLSDKASKLEEANEAEKEKAETKRQSKFKNDQKSLEKSLGF
jgi:hypothetical protein